MPVELSQLMQLALGKPPALQVGDLPRPVAEHLGCHPAIVWLGTAELGKIVRKHGDQIKVENLQCLPYAISDGVYYKDQNRPNCVTVYYRDKYTNLQYVIGLKPANRGGEVWIQTFYRIDDRKAARRQVQARILYVRKNR